MDFNLPTQPERSLQVTKELAAETEADKELVDNLQDSTGYKFRVVKADPEGNPTNDLLIKEGDTFTRTGVTEAERTGVVGEDGFFTLKRGQTAEFTNMLSRFDGSSSHYIVQEFLPDNLNTQFKSVLYNVNSVEYSTSQDSSTKTGFTVYSSPELSAGDANLVVCRNVVDTAKLSNLSITKKQVGSLTNGQPEYYYMKVSFGSEESSLSPISVGTSYFIGDGTYYVQQAGIIKLAAGKTANLKLILGTYYKVEEVAEANGTAFTGTESYKATYPEGSSGSIAAPSSNVGITVTNTYPNGSLSLKKTVTNMSAKTTLNVYSHITDTMREQAAVKIDRNIGGTDAQIPRTESKSGTTEKPPFEPYKPKIRKAGTGCISKLNEHLYEGRYSPRIDGRRISRNVYAKTREECEEKLAELIKEMKAEFKN